MNISFELIPSSENYIKKQLEFLKSRTYFNKINVPDILRFETRSWKVNLGRDFIPHLRASDFDLNNPDKLKNILDSFSEVLVIAGDRPLNPSIPTYRTSTLELIETIKFIKPEVKIYCGLDPYRSSFKEEILYAKEKFSAGADAIFTQPFFDKKLAELYLDYIDPEEVYIGISPVTTESSKSYWENVNNVLFPDSFNLSIGKQIEIAEELINISKNVYFMPIRTDLEDYFNKLSICK